MSHCSASRPARVRDGVELCDPRQGKLATELKAQPHGLDARAMKLPPIRPPKMPRRDEILRKLQHVSDAAQAMTAGAHIYDVRSHGYLDRNAMRITGSRPLDPNALHQSNEAIPVGQVVFVYCTCVREATSVRVARELEKSGIRVAVIKGGLRAWKKPACQSRAYPTTKWRCFRSFVSSSNGYMERFWAGSV
jgi:rhodanese-related sulfurtransferase